MNALESLQLPPQPSLDLSIDRKPSAMGSVGRSGVPSGAVVSPPPIPPVEPPTSSTPPPHPTSAASTSAGSSASVLAPPTRQMFTCQHVGCTKSYDKKSSVQAHVHDVHVASFEAKTVLGTFTVVRGTNGKLVCPVDPTVCGRQYTTRPYAQTHVKMCALEKEARASTRSSTSGVHASSAAAGPSPPSESDATSSSGAEEDRPGASMTQQIGRIAQVHLPTPQVSPPPARTAPVALSQPIPTSMYADAAQEIATLKNALAASSSQATNRILEHEKEVASLRRRVGEAENERDTLVREQVRRAAILVDFKAEMKASRDAEAELAAATATAHAAEVDALETRRRVLEDQLATIQSRPSSVQPADGESAKKIDKLEKRLALSARERDSLRGELAGQRRNNEAAAIRYQQQEAAMVAKLRAMEKDAKGVADLWDELKDAKEVKAEVAMLRASEIALRTTLSAREGDVNTLQAKLDQSTADNTALKVKLAAISADKGVGTSSLARPPKRPLPSDPSGDASSSDRAIKKAAFAASSASAAPPDDPKWNAGLVGTPQQKSAFKRHWMNKLIPRKVQGRTCTLCIAANPATTGVIELSPKESATDVAIQNALVAHLSSEHTTRWEEICAGLAA